MKFEIGSKVVYCGDNKKIQSIYSKENNNLIGEIVGELFSKKIEDFSVVKVKYPKGYLISKESDFKLYEDTEKSREREKLPNDLSFLKDVVYKWFNNRQNTITLEKPTMNMIEEPSFKGEYKYSWKKELEEEELDTLISELRKIVEEDKKKEEQKEIKPYCGLICYCGPNSTSDFTVGKLYTVDKGRIETDDGWTSFPGGIEVPESFEEFSKLLGGNWVEIKDVRENFLSNFYNKRILCVNGDSIEGFTKGVIYKVVGGYLVTDRNSVLSYGEEPFRDLHSINSYLESSFIEIIE